MSSADVAEVWEALRRYEGVPSWWAELFVNLGFSAAESVTWVEAAASDPRSALALMRERDLNVTLQGYAAARGIVLCGAGSGEGVVSGKPDRFVHTVSTITTPEEQEMVMREVGAYADVKFRDKLTGVYTQHAVANAVRSVHQAYMRKIIPLGSTILEAGASVKNVVLSGAEMDNYHCCSPVLCVRDSVRHSLRGWLEMVSRDSSKYKPSVRAAAQLALDESSGFVCRNRVQDCTRQVDVVCSNESTHDVPFDDLPQIMSRHGARLWVGFSTRAFGARRVGGPSNGKCSVFGTRWRVDKAKDKISFHFDRDGSFSYEHKFSEWMKYEEQFGFRWYGRYFDYVYTRMPITTQASLAFVVARVPKVSVMLREPVYKQSEASGMVEVTSIRAVGACTGTATPRFEPVKFRMEELVFDRVLETRLAQGERGNLASTIAYMRSARVRLAVNGVALGAVTQVPVEVLESAAVAIEVIAADSRKAGARDYAAIAGLLAGERALDNVSRYFGGLRSWLQSGATVLRSALAAVLNGPEPVVVRVDKCPAYECVSDGGGVGIVSGIPVLQVHGCGCDELSSVRAALKMGTVLSSSERRELSEYATALEVSSASCVVHNPHLVRDEEAEDVFFDCEEVETTESSCTPSVFDSTASVASTLAESESTAREEFVEPDGSVSSKPKLGEGRVVASIMEYAAWSQASDKCARSEAALFSDVLFAQGTPSIADVERSTTARTRHAVVAVVGGKVDRVLGTLRDEEEFAEVYVRSLRRTCKVYTDSGSGKRWLKENVTELCYTSSGLCVVNGDELCRGALRTVQDLPKGFIFPRYEFVNGVPGSGKTFEVIQQAKKLALAGKNVAYLTATRASRDEVREKLGSLSKLVVCKTYDSALIHGVGAPRDGGSFDMLFMDEACMAHKGQLYALMLLAKAKEVKLYGDKHQILWQTFMDAFISLHSSFSEDEVVTSVRSVTHRFGARTCAMWLDVYDEIFPCTCHEHSDQTPEVVRVTGASYVPKLPGGKVLVFTQEEKMMVKREMQFEGTIAELKSKDNGGLSTSAEDQGGTHDSVYVVRLLNKKNPKESRQSPSIYNRQPWVLVATTRHRGVLRYYTTCDDDLVVARIDLAKCPVRLRAVQARVPWHKISNEATSVREFGI